MVDVISVEHLSKLYRLGQIGTGTFANDLKVWWARMCGKPNPMLKVGQVDHRNHLGEEVWALKDLCFRVEQGEALGIIGRNGAGKSTLLKIMSRVTAPTEGRIRGKGRIASLLEVGTGFHPELTGRENIYLNGAVLGMKRGEINQKLDEIVEFSGVEKYIDTPVKRYSSGMYVRLAFAVAAHLDPEILVIDEVLAVGDVEFQKKCLRKMEAVAGDGRTVLFVSHNMESIEKFCGRVILLDKGSIADDGKNVRDIIEHYAIGGSEPNCSMWVNSGHDFENSWFKPQKVMLCDKHNMVLKKPVRNSDEIYLRIEGESKEIIRDLTIGYYCYSERTNYPVYLSQFNDSHPDNWPEIREGHNIIVTKLPQYIFNEGLYYIKLYVIVRSGKDDKLRLVNPDDNDITLSFEISMVENVSPSWLKRKGTIAPILPWSNNYL